MSIDILIPYWGSPSYMREAVTSVRAQTSPHWRLTVIDDAYPDREIGEWLADLADDRIHYLRKPENKGIIANFRSCLQAASQPLMTMMGADDRLLPNYVADVVAASAAHPEAAIIQPGVRVIDEVGRQREGLVELVKQRLVQPKTDGITPLRGEPLARSLLRGNWLYWPSLTFHTSAIKQFDFSDHYPIMLDLDIVLNMVFAGDPLLVLGEDAFEYRRHSKSLSSVALTDGSRFEEERRFYAQSAARAEALGWRSASRAARLRLTSRAHAALTLPQAIARRDFGACRTLFRHAVGR